MTITVFTWEFYPDRMGDRDTFVSADTGHAAVLVEHGTQSHYYSWWPCQDKTTGAKHTMLTAYRQDQVKMRRTRDSDKEADGIYRFADATLNASAAAAFMEDLHHGRTSTSWFATKGQFHKSIQNCSSAVAWSLWKAGCGTYYSWPGHFIWHPNNLAMYCQNLVKGAQAKLGADSASMEREMKTATTGPGALRLCC